MATRRIKKATVNINKKNSEGGVREERRGIKQVTMFLIRVLV
jgi:hypothetical protein